MREAALAECLEEQKAKAAAREELKRRREAEAAAKGGYQEQSNAQQQRQQQQEQQQQQQQQQEQEQQEEQQQQQQQRQQQQLLQQYQRQKGDNHPAPGSGRQPAAREPALPTLEEFLTGKADPPTPSVQASGDTKPSSRRNSLMLYLSQGRDVESFVSLGAATTASRQYFSASHSQHSDSEDCSNDESPTSRAS